MVGSVITHTILMIVIILVGSIFYRGKAGFLPSGIRWKESQVDARRLMKFTGIIMFCIAFCVGMMIVSDVTEIEMLHTIALIMCAVVIIIYFCVGNGKFFLK